MRRQQIEPGLALAIAGQVSIALTPGDGKAERSHMALVVIGLMLRQAAPGDELVAAALDLATRTRIEGEAGSWTIIPEPGPPT